MRKKTTKEVTELALLKGKEFCSSEYIGAEHSYDFRCLKCNNIFSRKYGNFTTNDSCPHCNKSERKYYNKLDIDHWRDVGKKSNLKLLSDLYINARTSLDWECITCNTIFSNSPCNIKAGSGCPKCTSKISKTEEKVRDIFETTFNKKFPSIRPNFLKNPKTKNNLELDGYCEELKLAFEYDGEFHYIKNPYREDGLQKQEILDELKTNMCASEGITLIRIPYWEKDNLESYIKNTLNTINLKVDK